MQVTCLYLTRHALRTGFLNMTRPVARRKVNFDRQLRYKYKAFFLWGRGVVMGLNSGLGLGILKPAIKVKSAKVNLESLTHSPRPSFYAVP